MKNFNTLAITVVTIGLLLVGCKGSESLTPSQKGEVEIVEYCSGAEFNTDMDHFRSTATGTSLSRETAKKMSRSNAEDKLARSVEATISSNRQLRK